jgi:hypothetical protein
MALIARIHIRDGVLRNTFRPRSLCGRRVRGKWSGAREYGRQHEAPSTAWSNGAPLGLDFYAIGPGAPCVRAGQASVVVTTIGRISVSRMGERGLDNLDEFVQLLPRRVRSVELDVDADLLGPGTLVLIDAEKTGEIEVGLEVQAVAVERDAPRRGVGGESDRVTAGESLKEVLAW